MVEQPTREIELVITKVENKQISSKNIDGLTTHTLRAEHTNHGLPKVSLTSEEPWMGFKYGDIITLKVSNTQTNINQFVEEEKNQVTGNDVKAKDPLKEDLKERRRVPIKPKK
jgi:hypothetical protein